MIEELLKLEFKIDYPDKESLLNTLFEIQQYYSLDNYLFKTFPNLKNQTNEEIADYFIENKEKIIVKLENRKKIIIEEWKKTESGYFEKVKLLTEINWRKNNFICYISPLDAGRYMLEINAIVCFGFDEDINETVNTIAEELFHIHFWHCLEGFGFKLNEETFSKYWELSEAVIGFVLPEIGLKLGPSWWGEEIKGLQEELVPLWENRNSFVAFLSESTELVDNKK